MKSLEELFKEFDKHLMQDYEPSAYFNNAVKKGFFEYIHPLNLLGDLIETPQSPMHHPEGSVWNHTMLVLDEGAKRREKSKNPQIFMWCALLHDIGKAKTTKLRKGKITSYEHEIAGEKLSIEFLNNFNVNENFIKQVSSMVRWHMQPLFTVKNMSYGSLDAMLRETDFMEIALFSLCDRLGRGNMTEDKVNYEKENIRKFIKKCEKHI